MTIKSLIIFDWDDTLFPTSWFVQNGINVNDEQTYKLYYKFFDKIDVLIHELLKKCINFGETIIITNATKSWVNSTLKLLKLSGNILQYAKIISAREACKSHTNDIFYWKTITFMKEYNMRNKINSNIVFNIISIGDAEYEYNALINLYNPCNNNKLKTIKLIKEPSIDVIINQLLILNKSIDKIIYHPHNLDWVFVQN